MSDEEEQEDEDDDEEEQPGGNGRTPGLAQHSPPAVTAQTQSSALVDWTSNTEGEAVYDSCDPHGAIPERGFGEN